ncbi:hypothetical protein TPHA_0B04903 [Tetrapisispora phaffii CBS 4417]|uniref:Uncharacterized protein n=1 Tax=Tetrapisispora phaffii (strain ATCC 24235 / CBS 4417 / NBRC 1672 / NRRL Y-8282 / UCD 70-5) TaxID=1071381 RepID=G8BQ80_TETPH|nr:hypothetical protein TPHA_0B04903 [Tetrapisispora phaffii CBS 4417]CCE62161.1 hypothetical protein TPHA_0B04903 [Tetrapisispora phaffii CBS 4417]
MQTVRELIICANPCQRRRALFYLFLIRLLWEMAPEDARPSAKVASFSLKPPAIVLTSTEIRSYQSLIAPLNYHCTYRSELCWPLIYIGCEICGVNGVCSVCFAVRLSYDSKRSVVNVCATFYFSTASKRVQWQETFFKTSIYYRAAWNALKKQRNKDFILRNKICISMHVDGFLNILLSNNTISWVSSCLVD